MFENLKSPKFDQLPLQCNNAGASTLYLELILLTVVYVYN